MIKNNLSIFIIYLLLLAGGVFLEVLVKKLHYLIFKTHYKEHHFSSGKYLLLLLMPFLSMLFVFKIAGFKLIAVFLSFSLVGLFIEWLLGWAYNQIEGQRLWTYHRYAIGKYTSFLTIPFWGMVGVLFWVLVKVFG